MESLPIPGIGAGQLLRWWRADMEGLIQIFIETLFDFRRGLLRQVKWLDDTIEKLTALKEKGGGITESDFAKFIRAGGKQPVRTKGLMPVDQEGLRKAAEELEIERNKKTGDALGMSRINPNDCEHKFVKDSCEKCAILEEFAKKGAED